MWNKEEKPTEKKTIGKIDLASSLQNLQKSEATPTSKTTVGKLGKS